jgi:formylglycine-generating enzyme required for sulfatase activity
VVLLAAAAGPAHADAAAEAPALKAKSAALKPAERDRAQAFFKQAFELFQGGAFEAARNRFRQGLEIDPGNALAHYYLAETLMRLKNAGEARRHYELTVALEPAIKEAALAEVALQKLPGRAFRDCPECPEMVVVPAGGFLMGSSSAEITREAVPGEWANRERPQHSVTIGRAFALGRFHVTRGEFAAFVRATGHDPPGCWVYKEGKSQEDPSWSWRDPGFAQTDRHPVVCVSHDDAKRYAKWLKERTGKDYRLASEAEWEYAARAGTGTVRYWGDGREGACNHANVADLSTAEALNWDKGIKEQVFQCRDGFVHTAPVGSFRANGFGLHDMLGNAWQWVADCWHDNYVGAPDDGSAWITGGNCGERVLRGGAWDYSPWDLRSANRDRNVIGYRSISLGFRLARTLD